MSKTSARTPRFQASSFLFSTTFGPPDGRGTAAPGTVQTHRRPRVCLSRIVLPLTRSASPGGRAASQCEQLPPPRPAESRVAMLRESLEHLCAGVQPDVTHDETWELTQHLASPSPFVNAASPSAPAAALTSTPPPLTVLPARAARAIRRRCART